MNTAQWSDALVVNYEPMDALHKVFVMHLAAAQSVPDTDLPDSWAKVVEHTERQFAREDEWMRKSRFSGVDNHVLQHRVVLKLLREGLVMAQAGEVTAVREMADQLVSWFSRHTQSQDAPLALHLRHLH